MTFSYSVAINSGSNCYQIINIKLIESIYNKKTIVFKVDYNSTIKNYKYIPPS